jgi:hypothetical protein
LQLVADADAPTSSTTTTKTAGVVDANIPNKAAIEFQKGRAALLEAHNLDEGIAHLEKARAERRIFCAGHADDRENQKSISQGLV